MPCLDNATTAMTGPQEHPGTGYSLEHTPTNQLNCEAVARAAEVLESTGSGVLRAADFYQQ